MKSVKIDKLNIFGTQPQTVPEVPEDLTDLNVVAGENISITKDSETGVTTISSSVPQSVLDNISSKQDALDSEQLDAVNSGIDSNLVSQIGTNTSEITNLNTNKQDKLTAGSNITIDANNVISASSSNPTFYLHNIYLSDWANPETGLYFPLTMTNNAEFTTMEELETLLEGATFSATGRVREFVTDHNEYGIVESALISNNQLTVYYLLNSDMLNATRSSLTYNISQFHVSDSVKTL